MSLLDIVNNLGFSKKRKFPRGASYRNDLTAEIEKYLTARYAYDVIYLREVGDVNYNLDIVMGYDGVIVGRVKRDPVTGWVSYVGLYTGITAEVRCFKSEAEDDHLFDKWIGKPLMDVPNPCIK